MEDTNTFAIQQFLKYVKINSQSNPDTHVTPSTQCQYDMQKELMKDLTDLGVKYTFDEKNCLLIGEIERNGDSERSIGFFCHVDTSSEASGENVKPLIHQLPEEIEDLVLPSGTIIPKIELKNYKNKKIITSSGDTLLGADDKSGIAIVMGMIKRIRENKEIKHPRMVFVFTPDEEIGESCDNVKIEELKIECAYSVDGSGIGNYNDEGFNAYKCDFKIEGVEVHPGSAYQIMEDAGYILSVFNSRLPKNKRPETTKENEPYIWCVGMKGCAVEAEASYILRSFEDDEMEELKKIMEEEKEKLEKEYVNTKFTMTFTYQYSNMKKYLPNTELTDKLIVAMKKVGVEPIKEYMRGGGDCSHLAAQGLPAINMFAGGENFHSRREFCSVEAINKGVETVVELIQLF